MTTSSLIDQQPMLRVHREIMTDDLEITSCTKRNLVVGSDMVSNLSFVMYETSPNSKCTELHISCTEVTCVPKLPSVPN